MIFDVMLSGLVTMVDDIIFQTSLKAYLLGTFLMIFNKNFRKKHNESIFLKKSSTG